MRTTLFHIPDTLFGLPVFGWGIAVVLFVLGIVLSHVWQYFRHRKISELGHSFAAIAIGIVVFVFVIPNVAEESGVPIRGYGFCLLVALLSACSLVFFLAKRQGIESEKLYSLFFWTSIVGIIGARLLYITEYWQKMFLDPATGQVLPLRESLFNALNFTQGGLVVFGSIIGGILAASIVMRYYSMPILRTFDAIAPGAALGIAIGRIGCLLNGCCFGCTTDIAWKITFPAGSPAFWHQVQHLGLSPESLSAMPVHPTQVYSSVLAFILCGMLLALGRLAYYRKRAGLVLASFMILYSIGRFCIEIVRTDEAPFFGTGLTISQNASILFCLAGIALFVSICRRHRRNL